MVNQKNTSDRLKEIATERTKIKATLNTADALCIALYGYENSI